MTTEVLVDLRLCSSSSRRQRTTRMKSTPFSAKSVTTIVAAIITAFSLPDSALGLVTGHFSLYDSLCTPGVIILPAPWDCSGFIRCDRTVGKVRAVWTRCDQGHGFNPNLSKCVAGYTGCPPSYEAALTYCPDIPELNFLHLGSCSMFYNCSQVTHQGALRQYEGECPYPQLFDADTWTCVPRPSDNGLADFCGSRSVPCSPCDYAVGCVASDRCVGLADGLQPDGKNAFSRDYVNCRNGSVSRATSCERDGQIFDPNALQCAYGVRDESVSEYCAKKPQAIFPDPFHCARYYNCSQVTWHTGLRSKQNECRYPLLFDVTTARCASFHDVKCGAREEPIQPCDYILGHCLDRPECIPCQASCLGLPNGYNSYPGYVLTAYHIVCEKGRTLDIRNCSKGLVFDPQLRTCGSHISEQTMDLYCSEKPDGRLPHPSECSLLYDCTHLMVKPNFPKYVSECKYPFLVDAVTAECKSHDLVDCGDRREPISPCDYLGNQCTSPQCTRCDLIMPSCYGKLNGFYSVINQEMTSSYMECRDQRVVSLSSCPGGLIFDMVDRKCVDAVSQVSMLQFCTNFLQGRVQSPSNCAQYYDCTKNLTDVQECPYPDLYHVGTRQCKHYSDVECGGRRVFLDPCDSYTFCPKLPCPYCPSAFPTCVGRNGAIRGFNFDQQLYYRCIDNRLILGRCQTVYNAQLKRCNESSASNETASTSPSTPRTTIKTTTTSIPTTTTKATTTTTTTTQRTTTKKTTPVPTTKTTTPKITTPITFPLHPSHADINHTCAKDPGFIAPKADNCAQYYNCSALYSTLGPYISECRIGFLFDSARGICSPRHSVSCQQRYEPLQACDYKMQNCPDATISKRCSPCQERFPTCMGQKDGPFPLPRRLSPLFIRCYKGRVLGVFECPQGQFMDPLQKVCTPYLTMNTTSHFCTLYPNTLTSHPKHCARYILCRGKGTPPMEGECPYPNLFSNGLCMNFDKVTCGARYEPKSPCEYASMRECPNKTTTCAPCHERFPSCQRLPDGFRPYPGKMLSPLFVKCQAERTMAIIRCVEGFFDPLSLKCSGSLERILDAVARDPASFCRQYPDAVVADPLHCARYYNCSRTGPAHFGRPYLSECRFPALFNRQAMKCDSFITVKKTVGCGVGKQPVHQCEYSAYCPNTQYRTCSDCYLSIPNCRHQPDGIHTIPPGRLVSRGFVYCLDQRALVFSECSPGFLYLSTSRTCVLRGSLPPPEPPEVK